MSMEKALERIADALEVIAHPLLTVTPPVQEAEKPVPKKTRKKKAVVEEPVVEEEIPVVEAEPVDDVGDMFAEEEPVAEGPKTPGDLRELAQKYLAASEKVGKQQTFVAFIKNTLCKKCGTDKLVKIEADKVPMAAELLLNHVKVEGILLDD